jgi:hypothetical protein
VERNLQVQTQVKPRGKPRVLLDTADWSDAVLTGRDGCEDLAHSEPGLRITYDFCHGEPSLTMSGPDGEVTFYGIREIVFATNALSHGRTMAETDVKKNMR